MITMSTVFLCLVHVDLLHARTYIQLASVTHCNIL